MLKASILEHIFLITTFNDLEDYSTSKKIERHPQFDDLTMRLSKLSAATVNGKQCAKERLTVYY